MSSVVQSQPPTYTEAQVLNSIVGVSEANILTLSSQDNASVGAVQEEAQQSPEDAANFEVFKQNIFTNPLFPLLAMMFEKCESATFSPDSASHNFEKELQAFMKHQESLKSPIWGEDEEVNELMIKAIQVLRIHLMEVEKVNDLCKDFCSRYITCLKSKLTSEHLLHVEGCDSPPPQDLSQGSHGLMTVSPAVQMPSSMVTPSVVGGNMVLQQQQQQPQIVSGNTVYQMVHTPQGIVAQPIQIQGPLTPLSQSVQPVQPVQSVIHGSTPLSQIGLSLTPSTQGQQQPQQQQQHHHPPHQIQQPEMKQPLGVQGLPEEEEEDEKNLKQKRGILPKQATQVMKSWLFQHIVHPYPTEDEKRQIASQTNLTLLQVNNWFINARRRILQPMLEASNPDKSKVKKPTKTPTRPQQRFWLDSAAPSNNNNNSSSLNNNNTSGSNNNLVGSSCGLVKNEKELEEELSAKLKPQLVKKTPERDSQVIISDAGIFQQQEPIMGFVSSGGVVLKVGMDGQILPSTSHQMTTPTHTSLTLDSLQALQSGGFIFTPGPTPLPLHFPLSTLSPTAGAGLGVGAFPGLAAATASPLTLGALSFNPSAYAAQLQLTGLNAAPIDLSTMSSSAPLQLNTLASAVGGAQQIDSASGQVIMGLAMQDSNSDPHTEAGEPELEAGELKIDTKDVTVIQDVGD